MPTFLGLFAIVFTSFLVGGNDLLVLELYYTPYGYRTLLLVAFIIPDSLLGFNPPWRESVESHSTEGSSQLGTECCFVWLLVVCCHPYGVESSDAEFLTEDLSVSVS